MGAVILPGPFPVGVGADPRPGIADSFVDLPARRLVAIAERAEILVQRLLIIIERMVAGMAHDRLEPAAEFEVRGFLRARLL